MGVSAQYRQFVLEQLEQVKPVRGRAMFGGVGIYFQDLFFALIYNDTLYFKVGQSSRQDYEERGMKQFAPYGDAGQALGYFEVPAGVLEDQEELAAWMGKAISEARAQGKRKRRN